MERSKQAATATTQADFDKAESILAETISILNSDKVLKQVRNSEALARLEKSLRELRKSESRARKLIRHWDLVLLSLCMLGFSIYLAYFMSIYYSPNRSVQKDFYRQMGSFHKWMVTKWLGASSQRDLEREECIVHAPDYINSVTRPVDDCAMCALIKNRSDVQRVSGISKEEFLDKYAYTGVPIIVSDALTSWSALHTFNLTYLKELYMNVHRERTNKEIKKYGALKELTLFKKFNQMMSSQHDQGSRAKLTCQFFPYKTKFASLIDLFETVEDDYMDEKGNWIKPWYVGWSNCNDKISKVLRQHYERPYFLPDDSEMSKVDWIFMGTPGYGADMHIDDVNNPSWQAQISGIKEWEFKPPAECLLKCPFSLRAHVLPGDVIIFDSNRWFHSTKIIGNDLSLTIGSEYD